MSDAYTGRITTYERRIEDLRDIVGDPSEITVSRLDIDADGIWFYPNWGALEQVLSDAGFARPELQTAAIENITGMSVENIAAFDGDIVLISYAPRFGQTIPKLTNGWMSAGNDIWRSLSAAQTGNAFWYERDIWAGYSIKSLNESIMASFF
ncbi:iron(III) dicitrate ABC transporter (lipoprotein) [Roseobacter sp. CCS2]|nr:iron(III) dicitrate ABC transporter (lipoprotein) [Roseobacter sp. CCS2]